MFTGLVEAKVPLVESLLEGAGKRMGFDLGPICDGVRIGDSIAINGCCLTVIAIDGTKCWFELGAETLSRTSLGKLKTSQTANCERSLKVGDRMGGHFVTGHIDGQGTLERRRDEGEWSYFNFQAPLNLLRQMASKGSITVDGVSLTLVDANDHRDLHGAEGFGLAREVLRRPVADDLDEHAAARRDEREVGVEEPRAHPHDGVLTCKLPPRSETADVRRETALHAAVKRSGQRIAKG